MEDSGEEMGKAELWEHGGAVIAIQGLWQEPGLQEQPWRGPGLGSPPPPPSLPVAVLLPVQQGNPRDAAFV